MHRCWNVRSTGSVYVGDENKSARWGIKLRICSARAMLSSSTLRGSSASNTNHKYEPLYLIVLCSIHDIETNSTGVEPERINASVFTREIFTLSLIPKRYGMKLPWALVRPKEDSSPVFCSIAVQFSANVWVPRCYESEHSNVPSPMALSESKQAKCRGQ